jgi:hypothetical protein
MDNESAITQLQRQVVEVKEAIKLQKQRNWRARQDNLKLNGHRKALAEKLLQLDDEISAVKEQVARLVQKRGIQKTIQNPSTQTTDNQSQQQQKRQKPNGDQPTD